tara:strand:- start:12390 stop:12722 length:333 start_codon:yes stop_codon:yes gene_type:complete
MATYQFKNETHDGIGTAGTEVYTVPATQKSIVIGCQVANITGASLPVEIQLVKTNNDIIHIAKSSRVLGGTTEDFLSGKKLVMQAGEKLKVKSKVDSSFDCVISVLEDVD